MRYYPVNLDLKGRTVLIVGGGPVAETRARTLVDAGATVRVVSPSLTGEMERWAAGGVIIHLPREFESSDVDGAFLVIGATNDRSVNEAVYRIASAGGMLCNVVDQPELCNFITPSILMRGDLQVTVSTSGRSPTVGQLVRNRIGGLIGDEYGMLLELSAELRRAAKTTQLSFNERRDLLKAFAESDALDMIRNGRIDLARSLGRELLHSCLTSHPS